MSRQDKEMRMKIAAVILAFMVGWIGVHAIVRADRLRRVIYWREEAIEHEERADSLKQLEQRIIGDSYEEWYFLDRKPKYPYFWLPYNQNRK